MAGRRRGDAMSKIELKLNTDILDSLREFATKDAIVKVGVLNDAARENGFGAAQLAAVHEFGSASRNIPKRSFLLKTMTNYKKEFEAEIKANFKKISESLVKNGPAQFLEKVGAKWVGYVQETFDREGPGWKKLKPATIAAKGSDKILQDTGAMKRSITHEVEIK